MAANIMDGQLRGSVRVRSFAFQITFCNGGRFGSVEQNSRASFICPPIPATAHTLTLCVMLN